MSETILPSCQCPECDLSFDKIVYLSTHYKKVHNKTPRELYIAFYLKGVEPTCKCGCGEPVRFMDCDRGFSEYKVGHISRIHNNWGHNEKALEKSQAVRREMFAKGELTMWNKGLTKETSEAVALGGKHVSETVRNNPEELKICSDRMRENRLSGVIPTLRGPEHSQSKGGFSPLLSVCHSILRLFNEWKYPKLVRSGFACEICKASRDKEPRPELEVHHDKIRLIGEEKGWDDYYAKSPSTDLATQTLKDEISNYHCRCRVKYNVSGSL